MDKIISDNKHKNKATGESENNLNGSAIDKEHNKETASDTNTTKRNIKETWPQRLTAICTLVIVFITGFYTYYAHEQVTQMKEAVRITGEQFTRDQRAWVGLSDIKIIFEVGKPIEFYIIFRNTGKTMAKIDTLVTTTDFLKGETPPDFTKGYPKVEPKSKPIIAALQEFTAIVNATDEPLSEALHKDVIVGKTRIYIHGVLKYVDIFGRHHWATFCAFIAKDGKSCNIYKKHNETDND